MADPSAPTSTLLCMLLDRSGSMAAIRSDVEGGFDAFIERQRAVPGACHVTLNQFDTEYETVYRRRPIADVPPLELVPRGATALHDAMGRTVAGLQEELAALPDDERPEQVIVVVLTDGLENSSVEWTPDALRALISAKQPEWEFVFIGAEQDAVYEGERLGIRRDQALTNRRTGASTKATYALLSDKVADARLVGAPIDFSGDDREQALADDG